MQNNQGRGTLGMDTLPREESDAVATPLFILQKEGVRRTRGGINERCPEDYC